MVKLQYFYFAIYFRVHDLDGMMLVHTVEKRLQCLYCVNSLSALAKMQKCVVQVRDILNVLVHNETSTERTTSAAVTSKKCHKMILRTKKQNSLTCANHSQSVCKQSQESRTAGLKLHKCQYCEKMFKSADSVITHVMRHLGHKPYKCQHCKKSFSASNDRLRHVRTVHKGLRPFACRYCGRSFGQSGARRLHEMLHTGDKHHECQYCDKRFRRVSAKKTHEMQHTGERPFQCQICEKTYTASSSLNAHYKHIHNSSSS